MERPGADSEEKREPVGDIDTAAVDSLKVLDPNGRLEKRTLIGPCRMSALDQKRHLGVAMAYVTLACRPCASPLRIWQNLPGGTLELVL